MMVRFTADMARKEYSKRRDMELKSQLRKMYDKIQETASRGQSFDIFNMIVSVSDRVIPELEKDGYTIETTGGGYEVTVKVSWR